MIYQKLMSLDLMIRSFIYILYKITNNLLFYILVKLNVLKSNVAIPLHKPVYFKINHKTTHLGDRLFLWDLVHVLNANGVKILLDYSDKNTQSFMSIVGIKFEIANIPLESTSCLSLKPMLLANILKAPRLALKKNYLDFQKFDGPLSVKLASIICQNLEHLEKIPFYPEKSNETTNCKKIVLFNNNVDSGRFRLAFVDKLLLEEKCFDLKKRGCEIWHVGSREDIKYKKIHYPFVDRDLRGTTEFADIIRFFRDGLVHEVVSFDNVFLHLAELYEVKSNILFRGRFTNSAKKHHFNSINIGLTRVKNKINYLARKDNEFRSSL